MFVLQFNQSIFGEIGGLRWLKYLGKSWHFGGFGGYVIPPKSKGVRGPPRENLVNLGGLNTF